MGKNTCKHPEFFEDQFGDTIKYMGRYITINEAGEQKQGPREFEANAYLIAAAPEMLNALKTLTNMCEGRLDFELPRVFESPIFNAKAAIAKAEGK